MNEDRLTRLQTPIEVQGGIAHGERGAETRGIRQAPRTGDFSQ